MEFSMIVDEKDINVSKLIASEYTEKNDKNKTFLASLGVCAFRKYLADCNINLDDTTSLFRVKKVFETTDLADVNYNSVTIDVRTYTSADALYIPKKHFDFNISNLYYVLAIFDENKNEVVFKGFINSNDVDKNVGTSDYYVVTLDKLVQMENLITELYSFEDAPDFGNVDLSGTFVALLDNELNEENEIKIISALYKSFNARKEFLNYAQFELVSNKFMQFAELFEEENNNVAEIVDDVIQTPVVALEQDLNELDELETLTEDTQDSFADSVVEAVVDAGVDLLENDPELLERGLEILSDGADMISNAIDAFDELTETELSENDFAEEIDGAENDLQSSDILEELIDVDDSNIVDELDEVEPLEDVVDENLDNLADFDENLNDEELSLDEMELETDFDTAEDDIENIDIIDEVENDVSLDVESLDDEVQLADEDEDNLFLEEDSSEDLIIWEENEGAGLPIDEESFESKISEDESEDNEFLTISDEEIEHDENSENLDIFSEFNDAEEIQETQEISEIEEIETPQELQENGFETNFEEDFLQDDNAVAENDFDTQDIEQTENDAEALENYISNISNDAEELISELSDDLDDVILENNNQNDENVDEYDYSETNDLLDELNFVENVDPENEEEIVDNVQEEVVENSEFVTEDMISNETPVDINDAINENIDIQTLFEKNESGTSENNDLSPEEYSKYIEQPSKMNTKKIVVPLISLAVLGSVAGLGGYYALSHKNVNQNNDVSVEQQAKELDAFDDETFLLKDELQADAISEDVNNEELVPNPDANAANDINQSISNIFDETIYPVMISKIAWEIPENYISSKYFKKYLQVAGVQLQRQLQEDLANVNEISTSGQIKLSFDLTMDNEIKNLKVAETSGSKEIDTIAQKTLKETLMYIKVPVIPSSENFISLTIVINF